MHSDLHYIKTGNGPTPLLMFHGFGQDNAIFNRHLAELTDRYTIYNFDLFFHGNSMWAMGEQALEKHEWKELIDEFITAESISAFHVLGFSMGGKFALATMELFPERVKEIILLAPDGIKTSYWYSLATYPIAFRKMFKSMIDNHARFKSIAKIAKGVGLIDKGVLRFVETQMDSEEKRRRVYYSWVVFRHLKFDMNHIAALIKKNNIRLRLFIGAHDKIITAKNMKKLTDLVPKSELQILDAGHNGVIAETFKLIGKQ
jgi:pimeloyl-ACP methyl ester carboxylesterase